MIINPPGHPLYTELVPSLADKDTVHRWIGRCLCGKAHKLEGRITRAKSDRGRIDAVIVAESGVYMQADHASNPYAVVVACADHWVRLKRVHEGKKQSKHECNAKCMASTGPSCDCKCKGKNHGSSH